MNKTIHLIAMLPVRCNQNRAPLAARRRLCSSSIFTVWLLLLASSEWARREICFWRRASLHMLVQKLNLVGSEQARVFQPDAVGVRGRAIRGAHSVSLG